MHRSFRAFSIALLALVATAHFWPWRDLRHGPGRVVAPGEPAQEATPPRSLGNLRGYEVTAVARYTLTARVLNTQRYYLDPGHKLVPIDLALGWGRMSDEAILDRLEISQAFRFYLYRWRGAPPIPPPEIVAHSANVHVIPATAEVERAAYCLRRGEVIRLTGQLVNANATDGRHWSTSLSRTDVGAGACELMYVESLERLASP